MMRRPAVFILLCLLCGNELTAQSPEEYVLSGYHNRDITTKAGDTINRLDSAGNYHGLHVYSITGDTVFNDTLRHVMGWYEHGVPIGFWTDRQEDGSFSVGKYNTREYGTFDDQGRWVKVCSSIYEKIGEWEYFSKDSQLLKCVKYELSDWRGGWRKKIYQKDLIGRYILVIDRSNRRYNGPFEKMEEIEFYFPSGNRKSRIVESFWREVEEEYYEDGTLKEVRKCRNLLGSAVVITYNEDGKRTGRMVLKVNVWSGTRKTSTHSNW